jgi:hypothetical protein
MSDWQTRIVEVGTEAPEQLLANPRNWRIHPKEQQDALSAVLDEIGWVKRVIVNRTTGCVLDGHLRVALAISRGESEIPISYVELSDEEERAVLATFDPLAELAERNDDAYDELVSSAEEPEAVDLLQRAAGSIANPPPAPSNNGEGGKGPVLAICPACAHEWDVEVEDG